MCHSQLTFLSQLINLQRFFRRATIFDTLLDMCREFYTFRTTENIIQTMSIARNGIICGADFSETSLPLCIPDNVKFSLNGKYPSCFRECSVNLIGILFNRDYFSLSGWPHYTFYSPNKKYILIIPDNSYLILWDIQNRKILWDYNLLQYVDTNVNFIYAEFSSDENYVTVFSDLLEIQIHIKTVTGEVISCNFGKINMDIDCSSYECNFIDEELKCEIYAQLTHFKNCDFRDSKFIDENYKEYLRIMGAIVD